MPSALSPGLQRVPLFRLSYAFYHGGYYLFDEWTTAPGRSVGNSYPKSFQNTTHNYQTVYTPSFGEFSFYLDGSVVDTAGATFVPVEAEQMGEVLTAGDQMPGGYKPGYMESFDNAQVHYGGSWHSFGGALYNNSPAYFGTIINGSTQALIWDKACAQ